MKLYLVQHGDAKPKAEDSKRRLTGQGRGDVARVAAFAQRAGVQIAQIRHSGKHRAEETAAILAEYLTPADGVVALPGLRPKGDTGRVAELLNRETRPLMLVGHRPFMDRLTGLLLAGSRGRQLIRFQKGGIVCLERDPKTWTWMVCWMVTPDLIP